jgi:hypothetical protein
MISSQKDIFGLSNNMTFGSSQKLPKLTALYSNPGISTKDDTMFWPKESSDLFHSYSLLLLYFHHKRQYRMV